MNEVSGTSRRAAAEKLVGALADQVKAYENVETAAIKAAKADASDALKRFKDASAKATGEFALGDALTVRSKETKKAERAANDYVAALRTIKSEESKFAANPLVTGLRQKLADAQATLDAIPLEVKVSPPTDYLGFIDGIEGATEAAKAILRAAVEQYGKDRDSFGQALETFLADDQGKAVLGIERAADRLKDQAKALGLLNADLANQIDAAVRRDVSALTPELPDLSSADVRREITRGVTNSGAIRALSSGTGDQTSKRMLQNSKTQIDIAKDIRDTLRGGDGVVVV